MNRISKIMKEASSMSTPHVPKPIETITITKEEYQYLTDRDFELSCLESGGVDNWSWYDESLQEYRDYIRKRKENEK